MNKEIIITVIAIFLFAFIVNYSAFCLNDNFFKDNIQVPCKIIKYIEKNISLVDLEPWEDKATALTIKADVKVELMQNEFGSTGFANLTIFEGKVNNILLFREYYCVGKILTCKIWPYSNDPIYAVSNENNDNGNDNGLYFEYDTFHISYFVRAGIMIFQLLLNLPVVCGILMCLPYARLNNHINNKEDNKVKKQ